MAIRAPSMLGVGSSLAEEEGGNVCVWTCSLAFLGVWINSRVGLLVPREPEFSCQKLLPRRPQQLYELRPLRPCWWSCWFPPPWADGGGLLLHCQPAPGRGSSCTVRLSICPSQQCLLTPASLSWPVVCSCSVLILEARDPPGPCIVPLWSSLR